MKKMVFLCHDPGGYDVIFPVAKLLMDMKYPIVLYCIGPAASLNKKYGASYDEFLVHLDHYINTSDIDLLITGTSWGSEKELEAISLCKKHKIKTIAILDYWSNYSMRFKLKNEYVYPDFYLVMDKIAFDAAVEAGVPEKIIKVVGHPGLDKVIRGSNRQYNFDTKNKILFMSQPLSLLYGNALGYDETLVLDDIIKLSLKYKYDLSVKFHPKDSDDFKSKYREFMIEGNLIDLLPRYDLVIGMNTMGLLHAVLLGVSAISYQPGLLKKDGCITNYLKLTPLVNSYTSLKAMFEEGEFTKYKKHNENDLIWLDGRSTERVKEFIISL